MAFDSNKQRKAFFASKGNVRSNVNPQVITFFSRFGNVRIGIKKKQLNNKVVIISDRKVLRQGDIKKTIPRRFVIDKKDIIKIT